MCIPKPEIMIGILSIIVALIALIATIRQAYLSQRHNKLSVRPHICQNPHFIDHDESKLTISITNKGLGTAVIRDFKIQFNHTNISRCDLKQKIGAITTKDFEITLGFLSVENALSKDEKFILLEIEKVNLSTYSDPDNIILNVIELLRGKLSHSIEYESIYGEQQNMNCKFE